MANLPSGLSPDEIASYASDIVDTATEEAPATMKLTAGGVTVAAAAFGPAGGFIGATAGSGIGALIDEGYITREQLENAKEFVVDVDEIKDSED